MQLGYDLFKQIVDSPLVYPIENKIIGILNTDGITSTPRLYRYLCKYIYGEESRYSIVLFYEGVFIKI